MADEKFLTMLRLEKEGHSKLAELLGSPITKYNIKDVSRNQVDVKGPKSTGSG
jgi:hypothetical protein